MTSLDPSHFPAFSNSRRHGQAVHESVSALHPEAQARHAEESSSEADAHEADEPTHPAWKGAWARRQAARQAAKEEKQEEVRKDGKIPVPPIPDLRFEQGVLMSIRPFIHRAEPSEVPAISAAAAAEDVEHPHHDEKVQAGERGAVVGTALTAEGAEHGLPEGESSDIFMGPLRIEWGQLSYVIVRDQFIYPLLQGLLWGVGSLWLGSLWSWNRARLAAKSGGRPAPSGPGLLARLGINVR
ncbi:hypothetical protein BCR35DRAFT_351623 [Leucosporidium creatinivorum]|uniref:Uncharacterized protein n=1 Tax=Leucosporidium creatinivorum TaxID=106004 RepID=A0A1Y2FMX1_9BASI|nr:hypothetical protein BCR35DRAFT_351623 [Leucosporidium creatinivorum]